MTDGPFRTKAEMPPSGSTDDERFGKIMPWRGVQQDCVCCGAQHEAKGGRPPTYRASGGTTDGKPCRHVIEISFWGRDKTCGDPRPHFHATCTICNTPFKMRARHEAESS